MVCSSEPIHTTARGVRKKEFVFRRDERFEKLSLFFSFSDGRQDRSQFSPFCEAVENVLHVKTRDIEAPLHTAADKAG